MSLRYIFRLIFAFISRFKVIMFFGILIGVVGFLLIGKYSYLLNKQTTRIGYVGRFTTNNIPVDIKQKISYGLTTIDTNGIPQPAIAKSWEVSDDGKTWTFSLSDNTWQDGKNIISKDINYQFSDASMEAPDNKTVVFKLNNAFSPFASVVSEPLFKKGLLGNGEYRVDKIRMSGNYISQLTLVNKDKDTIIYKFYPTEDRVKLAFKLGQVDRIDVLDSKPFDTWRNVKIDSESDSNRYVGVFFNTDDDLVGDKTIRQALNYAIDKTDFDGPRILGPISSSSWAYNPQTKPYTYDEQRALDLLSEMPKEVRDNMEIKLATFPLLLPTAEKIAQSWNDIGVKTTIQVSSIVPEQYQAFLAIVDTPTDPDQYTMWHSTQLSTNICKYKSPRIDKLLEDGRTTLNQEDRKRIYLDFQRFLAEDSPAIFLYQPTFYSVSR